MKHQSLTTPLFVVAASAACAALLGAAPAASVAAAAASPSPAPAKHADTCGSTKSKWEHMQCMEYNSSAPGDEYFGRMKMSYLGIDNTFKDMTISAGAYTTDPRIIAKLAFADEALARWASKYPNDPQLARSYFLGIGAFRKVYTQADQQIAWNYIQLLTHKFPTTYFGKAIKADLAKTGFTEHWFALPQMCPTPLPKGVVAENTPSATETPSPAPGQPGVDIIDPPCVQPSPAAVTPSPSPTPKKNR